MKRFVDGVDRSQGLLLPDRLEDYVHEDYPVRVVDAFVEALDLSELGFEAANRAAGGRPAYHPAALLKIYIYGYLNRIPSSRRLEREAQRNLELIWLAVLAYNMKRMIKIMGAWCGPSQPEHYDSCRIAGRSNWPHRH